MPSLFHTRAMAGHPWAWVACASAVLSVRRPADIHMVGWGAAAIGSVAPQREHVRAQCAAHRANSPGIASLGDLHRLERIVQLLHYDRALVSVQPRKFPAHALPVEPVCDHTILCLTPDMHQQQGARCVGSVPIQRSRRT